MDLWNNQVGLNIGNVLFPLLETNASLSNPILDALNTGKLRYLIPTLPPPFFLDGTPNPNGDPNFYGWGGIPNISTATHGIIPDTKLTPTNQ